MRFTLLVGFCVLSLAAAQRDKAAKLRKELESPYKIWVTVDVAYIITDDERKAFDRLSNDAERESFIEQFWLRRDPTPDTEENEFKEEHYRRIAYANERFASGIPGWKTDRGMIYIKYGPPDEVDSHPTGGSYQRPPEQGGALTTVYPFEQWRYRYIEDIGTNVVIEFVDQSGSGEYRLALDPTEKEALQHVPGYQPPVSLTSNEFDLLERFAAINRPPANKFHDREAAVTINIRYNMLPMKVRTDFIPVTPASIYANITLQFDSKDLQFQQRDGIGKATINLYARVSTMSRRVVTTFEDVVSVEGSPELSAVYQKTLALAPGRYRLNIAAKDVTGGNTSTYETVLEVPRFEEDRLSASSLILADLMERVPMKTIGAGQFVIGDTKVRPRMNQAFRGDEKLGIYVQLYHFAPDEKTHKPNGSVEYQISRNGSDEIVFDYSEEASAMEGSSSQVTIEKWLPLKTFAPGSYTLRMKVTDWNRQQAITPSAAFTIIEP